QILLTTRLPIEFWRMISALIVTFFVVRSFGVFDAIQRRKVRALQEERDRAQWAAFEAQIAARQTAEGWTDALVSISRRIAELDDVDSILLYITENTRQLLDSEFSGLAIADGDSGQLRLKYCSSNAQSGIVDTDVVVENPLILGALNSSTSYRSHDGEPPEMLAGTCPLVGSAVRAVAVVPLDLDNHSIGAFWIARSEARPYSETDLIWLECLADQVVIAIKHGLMTAQLQSLSITEERGRIAREMHDGLAQVLGYLNLQVQTLEAFLQQRRWDKLEAKLVQMREAVQVAHADVRENILSLRTTLANEKGVIPAIAEYLEEFAIQTKLDAQFLNEVDEETRLSSLAEVQLVCILQEALTNVRKHSNAEHVTVRLVREGEDEEEHVALVVSDDGTGFASGSSTRSFGLQTMRERAHSVGGELMVSSAPGKGTRVECRIPCLDPERLSRRRVALR
ncbi:MAG TPA: GAF domain-containing sensor histidine kinase, partial [Chloroflexota bacterium]